jgi:hypothetical protein
MKGVWEDGTISGLISSDLRQTHLFKDKCICLRTDLSQATSLKIAGGVVRAAFIRTKFHFILLTSITSSALLDDVSLIMAARGLQRQVKQDYMIQRWGIKAHCSIATQNQSSGGGV